MKSLKLIVGIAAVTASLWAAPQKATGKPPDSVAAGAYECWANGEARPLLNFSVTGAGQYTDSDGKKGSFAYDAATGKLTFKGGALDGAMPPGFSTVYEVRKGKPTVSFVSARGSEASFCEKK